MATIMGEAAGKRDPVTTRHMRMAHKSRIRVRVMLVDSGGSGLIVRMIGEGSHNQGIQFVFMRGIAHSF
jgi:hypothetical protein